MIIAYKVLNGRLPEATLEMNGASDWWTCKILNIIPQERHSIVITEQNTSYPYMDSKFRKFEFFKVDSE